MRKAMKLHWQKTLSFCLLILVNTGLYGQEWFPDHGFLYKPTDVARVDIAIDQDSLDMILEAGNEESDHEYPAIFSFKRGATQSTIDSIGFRLRGNTSRKSAKKSFKVSLNTFIPGQKYHEVEKINLNGEHNDPSIARAHICWELFRRAGVPAPRSGHAQLYINGEYKGLYINVEHIDDEFVRSRFGRKMGNLYKCLWPADLTYIGDDPDKYKLTSGDRQVYELKTNLLENDYSDLAELIRILDQEDPENFPEYLEPMFNVNSYLKSLVVEILTGHWDNYAVNKNNYYLYHNQTTGKFEYIPYDPDNTFGIDWYGIDWADRNIYNWCTEPSSRPLTDKILQNDIYRDRFSFYMERFLREEFNSEKLDPFIDEIRSRILPFIEGDVYRTFDYGYTVTDFYNSFDEAIGEHVKDGIKSFVESRSSSAMEQVESVDIAPAVSMIRFNRKEENEGLYVLTLVEDEEPVSNVTAFFAEKGQDYSEIQMTNVGGDVFQGFYPVSSENNRISFYIEAIDQGNQMTREPPFGVYSVDFGLVSNESFIARQPGIEISPNPASTFVKVNTQLPGQRCSYTLYNLLGQQVLSGESSTSLFRINIDVGLPDGIYILDVSGNSSEHGSYKLRKKILISSSMK